jgi:hypothetical protein
VSERILHHAVSPSQLVMRDASFKPLRGHQKPMLVLANRL